jgi:hypothetical protein
MKEIAVATVIAAAAKLPGGICDATARQAMLDLGFTAAKWAREKREDGIYFVAVDSGDRKVEAVSVPGTGS